jgi:hypothetical protein
MCGVWSTGRSPSRRRCLADFDRIEVLHSGAGIDRSAGKPDAGIMRDASSVTQGSMAAEKQWMSLPNSPLGRG